MYMYNVLWSVKDIVCMLVNNIFMSVKGRVCQCCQWMTVCMSVNESVYVSEWQCVCQWMTVPVCMSVNDSIMSVNDSSGMYVSE